MSSSARLTTAGRSAVRARPEADNPFVLRADEDVFRVRERERQKQEEARAAQAGKKIWEKTDFSSTLSRTRKAIEELAPDVDPIALRKAKESKGLITAATAAISRDRRHEKESMADFVAKKREMFLLQMSLDIKREEIAKLEQKASQKEEALKKSELMLEEDAIRFDAFLKENDQQAHDALKKAEALAKAKAEKMHDLKKLKHAIGLVAAEKGKLKEVLDDYKRYQQFLDALTPADWTAEILRQRAERIDEERVRRYEVKISDWEAARAVKEAEVMAHAEMQRRLALKAGKVPPKVDIAAVVTQSLPPMPELDDEPRPTEYDDEDLPMYFTQPQQLLDIFTQLEESNLFLIQNCQDTEQQLEELRQQYSDTSAAMQRQTTALNEQMATLQVQLAAEEAKAAALRRKISDKAAATSAPAVPGASKDSSAPGGVGDSDWAVLERMLPELRQRIIEVYERCGFKATASSDTISMLTQLEGRLEGLLATLATMDPEYVVAKEKEKDKDRRARVREARLKAQQEGHEERQLKMLQRAQAPVVKREGKPVMFRSQPFPKKVVAEKPDPLREQEKEDAKHFQ